MKDISLAKENLKNDWKAFCAHLKTRAVESENILIAVKEVHANKSLLDEYGGPGYFASGRSTARAPRPEKTATTQPRGQAPAAGTPPQPAKPTIPNGPQTYASVVAGEQTQDRKGEPQEAELPDCPNPDCPGKHLLKDCPNTSPQRKRELYKELKTGKKSLSRVSCSPPQNLRGSGRFQGTLADAVPVTIHGDYGADHSALSKQHLDSLLESDTFAPMRKLKEPVQVRLAVDSDQSLTADTIVRIPIALKTVSGPLRFRNVEFLVMQQPMEEVLLSRPLLMSIGFDLEARLNLAKDVCDDADFSDIRFHPRAIAPMPKLSSFRVAEPSAEIPILDLATPPADAKTCANEVGEALGKMMQNAIENGSPPHLHEPTRRLAQQRRGIFRLQLGKGPPANLPPMEAKLKPDAKPARMKARKRAPAQKKLLGKKATELENLGLVRKNTQSAWASAPLIAPKGGPEGFRFAVDLRHVNSQTAPHIWPMPDLETATQELQNDACYATIDLCQGYWQLALHENSQELRSFVAPTGAHSPARAMQGAINAVAFFQSSSQRVLRPQREEILQWIDDLLARCKTPEELLAALGSFFPCARNWALSFTLGNAICACVK